MKTLPILIILFAIGMASAAITINYTGTAATIKNGGTVLADVKLLNNVLFNGSDYFLNDCDILSCRLLLNITPKQDWVLTAGNKLKPNVAKSINGYTMANGTYILTEQTEQYQEPTYSIITLNYTDTNTSKVIFYNNTIKTGEITKTRNITIWKDLLEGTTLNANIPITVALDYKRTKVNDTADLVPEIFGLNMSQWAWWNTTWGYAIPCNINTTVASALTNFPAMCQLSTTNTTLWNATHCGNVRFLDSTNTTVLSYDLDDNSTTFCGASATANATYWIKANTTAGGITTIWAYLGNIGASNGETNDTWSGNNFVSVWHFSGGLADELGANSLANTTPTEFITTSGSAKYGRCANVTATGYLNKASSTVPSSNSASTSTGWISKPIAPNSGDKGVINWGTASIGKARYLYINNNGGTITLNCDNHGGSSGCKITSPMVNLQFVSATFNSTTGEVEKNASSANSGTFNNALNTDAGTTLYIGTMVNTGNLLTDNSAVCFDEFRVANIQRSLDWITAEYAQTSTAGTTSEAPAVANANIYIETSTPSYNGTHITYNFKAIVIGNTASTNTNISILSNGTIRNSTLLNITAGGIYLFNATWNIARGTADSNFTATATAADNTGKDASVLLILPIDPPSAMAIKHPIYAPILTTWSPLQWVWGLLYTGNVTMVGSSNSWSWQAANRGAGTNVRNGSSTSWAWVGQ